MSSDTDSNYSNQATAEWSKDSADGPPKTTQSFIDWQRTNHRPSVQPRRDATANEMIKSFQAFLNRKIKPEKGSPVQALRGVDVEEEACLDLFELLMKLPVELQLLVFESLNAIDIFNLSICSQQLRNLMELLTAEILATRPQIGTIKKYLAKFNYKDVPFLKALAHWNANKGIELDDQELNGIKFARFYVLQNIDASPDSIIEHPEEYLGGYPGLALQLTHLHLSTHLPHQEAIKNGYNFLYSPEWYENEIRELSKIRELDKADVEDAIHRIKQDQNYLAGRIWGEEINVHYGSNGNSIVKHEGRRDQLRPLTQIDAVNDDDVSLMVRRLGLPSLPHWFEGDEELFMYRTDTTELYFQLQHLGLFRPAMADVHPDLPSLAKVEVIDSLRVY